MTEVAGPGNARGQPLTPKTSVPNTAPWRRKALDAVQQRAALLMSEHQPSGPLASWLGTTTPVYHSCVNEHLLWSVYLLTRASLDQFCSSSSVSVVSNCKLHCKRDNHCGSMLESEKRPCWSCRDFDPNLVAFHSPGIG